MLSDLVVLALTLSLLDVKTIIFLFIDTIFLEIISLSTLISSVLALADSVIDLFLIPTELYL